MVVLVLAVSCRHRSHDLGSFELSPG